MRQAHIHALTAAAALCLGAASAGAQPACKPVVGSFQATAVPPGQGDCPASAAFCTAGRVWGGIQGRYGFTVSALTPSAPLGGVPTVFFFTGVSTVQLNSGATLVGVDTGSLDLPPGRGGFASLITFAGDAGQIRLRGELGTDGTTGDYLGVLCTP